MKSYKTIIFFALLIITLTSFKKQIAIEDFKFAGSWELQAWYYGDSLVDQSACTNTMSMILGDDSSMILHYVNGDCKTGTIEGKWYIDEKGRFVKWTEIMPTQKQIGDIIKISGDTNFKVQPHQSHQRNTLILVNKNIFKTQIELWPAPWELEEGEVGKLIIETMVWKRI